MTTGGPDRPLILPPRSDDIFSPDYHPSLAEQEDINFKALKQMGLARHREPENAKAARKHLWLLLAAFIGSIGSAAITLTFLL
jgi:hypothetical protein